MSSKPAAPALEAGKIPAVTGTSYPEPFRAGVAARRNQRLGDAFGLKNFGTIYGGLLTALSIGTAFGPLAAAAVYDTFGSYTPFLALTIAFMALSSLALASLPQPEAATA